MSKRSRKPKDTFSQAPVTPAMHIIRQRERRELAGTPAIEKGFFYRFKARFSFSIDLHPRSSRHWCILYFNSLQAKNVVFKTFIFFFVLAVLLVAATYKRNIVWKDRVALWEDVVIKSPDSAKAHYNLGTAFYDNRFVDKAIEQYKSALRLDPAFTEAHNNLGIAYDFKGWVDEAIEHYRTALSLRPEHAKAHSNLGTAYLRKGWIDKAIEEYQIALRLKPDFGDAHYNLGNAYYGKGWVDKATEEYQIASQLKPNFGDAHYNLGNMYLEKGIIDMACKEFKAASIINQDSEALRILQSLGNSCK